MRANRGGRLRRRVERDEARLADLRGLLGRPRRAVVEAEVLHVHLPGLTLAPAQRPAHFRREHGVRQVDLPRVVAWIPFRNFNKRNSGTENKQVLIAKACLN